MSDSRYKKFIMTYGIINILVFAISIVSIFLLNSGGFLLINPIDHMGLDMFIITSLWIVAIIIGAIIGGYLLGPLFLIAQKKTIGRGMIYGIQDKKKSEVFKGVFYKALFPALLAVNLTLMISSSPAVQALSISSIGSEILINQMLTISALLPLLSGIALGIFSPIWFLEDAGIVYTNKEKVKDKSTPTELRSVGGWYMYLIKGYAGISVFINFYLFFVDLAAIMGEGGPMMFMFFIFWPIMPLLIALMMGIGIVALDITFEKRREFMRKVAKKMGISEPLKSI